jgi:WhiB family transcriptional regulator, redox-sensing transcriptional regulator
VRNPRHHHELTNGFIRWLMDDHPGGEFLLPSDLLKRPAWHEEALCRGIGPGGFVTSHAKLDDATAELCAACPVRQDCLDFALTIPELVGVWGGTTQAERRWLIRPEPC